MGKASLITFLEKKRKNFVTFFWFIFWVLLKSRKGVNFDFVFVLCKLIVTDSFHFFNDCHCFE